MTSPHDILQVMPPDAQKLLIQYLDERVNDAKDLVVTCDKPDEVEMLRGRARAYHELNVQFKSARRALGVT